MFTIDVVITLAVVLIAGVAGHCLDVRSARKWKEHQESVRDMFRLLARY